MFEFTDEWGSHKHATLPAPPYDPAKKIDCVSCLSMLDSKADVWEASLSKRHNLSSDFWEGYVRTWNKE